MSSGPTRWLRGAYLSHRMLTGVQEPGLRPTTCAKERLLGCCDREDGHTAFRVVHIARECLDAPVVPSVPNYCSRACG